MSRACRALVHASCGFPRVSGDEPDQEFDEFLDVAFSPRERG